MWLGNFDVKLVEAQKGTLTAEGKPIADGKPVAEGDKPGVDWHFYPHPTYRQGLLLFVPQGTKIENVGTALNFPIKAAQEIALRFATADELPK